MDVPYQFLEIIMHENLTMIRVLTYFLLHPQSNPGLNEIMHHARIARSSASTVLNEAKNKGYLTKHGDGWALAIFDRIIDDPDAYLEKTEPIIYMVDDELECLQTTVAQDGYRQWNLDASPAQAREIYMQQYSVKSLKPTDYLNYFAGWYKKTYNAKYPFIITIRQRNLEQNRLHHSVINYFFSEATNNEIPEVETKILDYIRWAFQNPRVSAGPGNKMITVKTLGKSIWKYIEAQQSSLIVQPTAQAVVHRPEPQIAQTQVFNRNNIPLADWIRQLKTKIQFSTDMMERLQYEEQLQKAYKEWRQQ